MNKALGSGIFRNIQIVALAAVLLSFALLIIHHQSAFPDKWFPSHFATPTFTFIFCAWILSELINNLWSSKNSQTTNKDKGSYRVIVFASYAMIFIAFMLRSFEIGTYYGDLQYIGFILIVVGIFLREWSVWVLGKHFTVRVQVREKAKLVTQGPYKYIRHPSYTGGFLTFLGIPLAIGTWTGTLVAFVVSIIVYQYRISVEEVALLEAFGTEYGEYKRRTWRLFPGF
jgi:protein-S-isoprenylcysteine O-methyltransferase Ste14